MNKLLFSLFIIFFIVILDQWSKWYITSHFELGEMKSIINGFFNLKYVQNKGAAFGFGNQYSEWVRLFLFKVLPVFACMWLFQLLLRSFHGTKVMTYAYAFVLGGAIGNIIDRIRLDYVVDFFDFYIKIGESASGLPRYKHFATFNVADAFISVAAILIIIDYFMVKKKKLQAETSDLSEEQQLES